MSLFDQKMYLISTPERGWWCGGDQWTKHYFEEAVLFQSEEAARRQAKALCLQEYTVTVRDLQIVPMLVGGLPRM